MSVQEDAARLEALLPKVMSALFHSQEGDPLRHHTVGQIRLMRILLSGSRTASELSHMLGLSPSSLTQMASRMISAGLVSKELGSEDRRVRRLSLTPAGRQLMDNRQAMRARAAAQVLKGWDEQKRKLLLSLLDEITGSVAERSFALVEAAV